MTQTVRVLLSVEEAAAALSMSVRKLYDEIHAGRLRAVKTSLNPDSRPHWKVPVAAVEEFVASLDDNQAHLRSAS